MENEHSSDQEEAAKSKFREVLRQIPTPQAQGLNDLIERGLVRVLTGEVIRTLVKNRGIVFDVCFDPKTMSAKAFVDIDSETFLSKGPLSLKGAVRDVSGKFGACYTVAAMNGLSWQPIDGSEIETFVREASSGGGKGYRVMNI